MFSITLERVLTDKSLNNVYIHNIIHVVYKKKKEKKKARQRELTVGGGTKKRGGS